MSEPTPSLPVSRRVRGRWHRVRVYGWAILVILAFWFFGLAILIRYQPKRFVDHALAEVPFATSTGTVTWLDPHTLQITDMKLDDFFYADSVIVTLSGRGLISGHIAGVSVNGCQLFTKGLNQEMGSFHSPLNSGLNWTIDKFQIRRGTIMVQSLLPDTPAIPIRLGVSRPIILNNIKLNKPDSSPAMTKEQTAEIENINISSPFDPLAPVFTFPLTRVRFTYTELWHHHIREVDFVRPTMFLGQDLFWFTNEFKEERLATPAVGITAPWQVGHLEVQYGQLAISAFGQPAARLPFYFETKVNDIRLDQLDKLSAKSTISIVRLDQDYPDYKIRIVNLHGKLEFSLPPSDASANNVVPTVYIDELSWNDIPAKEVWASATFDPTGIYGKLGGKCENGYLKANFEVYYTKGFTWNTNFFADKIDCQPVAAKIAGKYLDMTGTLDGKIAVQGRTTEILNCQGTLQLANPGVVEIKSLGNLMKRLPGNASITKQDLMKITIKTFETYPYSSGQLKIDYKPSAGSAILSLNSPLGQRQASIYWHPFGEGGDGSKVANEANTR